MESEDQNQNFWDFKIYDEDDEHKSMTIFDVKFEILLFDRGGEICRRQQLGGELLALPSEA